MKKLMKPESYVFNDSLDPLASAAVCVFIFFCFVKNVLCKLVSFRR